MMPHNMEQQSQMVPPCMESPWERKEIKSYCKSNPSPGINPPEYVRIYASNQDVSRPHPDKCYDSQYYAKQYASACDIYEDDCKANPNYSETNGRTRLMIPDLSRRLSNNSPQQYSSSVSPGHVSLNVPHDSSRRCSASSCSGDDVSVGMPTTYPPQPLGSMSCLTAEIPLSHIDFWPGCRKRALMACDAKFEKFDSLVRRANKWLQQFYNYDVVSVETVDKKVIYVKDIYNAAMYFTDEDGPILATHIKGLRLWYHHVPTEERKSPQELGFCDTIPRYLNPGEKHPRFETLPQTIDKINTRLSQTTLPGDIISIETVSLKVAREDWSNHIQIEPCHCQWYDEYNTHQLNFVRIFYLKGDRSRNTQQVIGIQDFTPDALDEGGILHPAKYTPFTDLFKKTSVWIQKNPNLRVTNIQTLDTKHRKKSENYGHRFNTDKMFEYRIEERFRAFFVRIGYVLKSRMVPQSLLSAIIIPAIQCRMYLPYKKTTGYENITEMLQRVDAAIEDTGARVYHVETVSMPEWVTKPELCEKGDRTFYDGEWYFVSDQDGNDRGPYRYTMVYAIKVYYEGLPSDYGVAVPPAKKRTCCAIL